MKPNKPRCFMASGKEAKLLSSKLQREPQSCITCVS